MIREHVGGEAFFDNIDKAVQRTEYVAELYRRAVADFGTVSFGSISSGKFGLYFTQTMQRKFPVCLTVNGGLRSGEKIITLEPFRERIQSRDFIFFDDSFYKGRTRDAVQSEIEKWGGRVIATYVCYDGSYKKDPTVRSLYRYYDHHFSADDLIA
jgi:hypothetical protein